MKTNYWQLCLTVIAALFVTACSKQNKPAPPLTDAIPQLHVIEDGERLWIEIESQQKQLIADDGQGYKTTLSADRKHIVVDVALLSNLQVTRLLSLNEQTNKFEPAGNLSQQAWVQIARDKDIDLESITNARTRFLSWTEDGRIVMEVSCQLENGDSVLDSVTLLPSIRRP